MFDLKFIIPLLFYGSVIIGTFFIFAIMMLLYVRDKYVKAMAVKRRKKFKVIKGSKKDAPFFRKE